MKTTCDLCTVFVRSLPRTYFMRGYFGLDKPFIMKEQKKLLYLASIMLLTVFTNEINNIPKALQPNRVLKINNTMKYILLWTLHSRVTPIVFISGGQEGFINQNCKYTNCFTTFERNYLGDITEFDVIVFSGCEIVEWRTNDIIPVKRSPHQKYAFATFESADSYPVCSNSLNNFFNWTWTYRLDSDARWGYLIVRDATGNVIGPRRDMHWIQLQDMTPVSEQFRNQLMNKTRAAAWFVSNCHTVSGREHFVSALQKALARYNLEVDVYGACGPYQCAHKDDELCYQLIKKNYYFYLAFENSFSEDYVTEKVLHGLRNNAVPIVYGGANYTRFMPDGVYLNARELGPKKLAKLMRYLIDHPTQYAEYFRWKNHYSFHSKNDHPSTNDYCGFCELINNKEMMEKQSIYKNFNEWWSESKRCLYFGEHL